jgi:hypothetical protein
MHGSPTRKTGGREKAMPRDERKRQDQLARKAAKRKKHLQSSQRSTAATTGLLTDAMQVRLAAGSPVHECLVPDNLFELGMGNVVFSRKTPGGRIVAAIFLLDVFCLGVKNAFTRSVSEGEYRSLVQHITRDAPLESFPPSCLRKVVEEAEAYARDLGFSPHSDYRVAREIFGDVDRSACSMSFQFGKDGKPFYISGPRDTPERSRAIVDLLMERCGPGGFDYLVALPEPP